ncbi:hypothetical protein [Pseudomonas alabamensis]|uniref:hypothetical protein n=1 Tax=Pseudomonas alabamensis TaxID=3064349 RepID=UPI0021D8E2D3|nr:hypothetical protein [Pseudomonas entomophila]
MFLLSRQPFALCLGGAGRIGFDALRVLEAMAAVDATSDWSDQFVSAQDRHALRNHGSCATLCPNSLG